MTDYIIVGGGSAGCVLANRLSADPSAQVTLVEAGGWDSSIFIRMPAGYFHLMRSGMIDWGYHTEPQIELKNRRLFWPRGKALGGSTCVNGMIYIRGDATDFDHWAALGNRNWSFNECLPYFIKSEQWQGPASPYHGIDGPLQTSRHGVAHPLSRAFVEAGNQAGYPLNGDFNGEQLEGFGPCDSTIDTGGRKPVRSSTAHAYLHPVKDRKNLQVITKALVTKIIVRSGRAVGIEYVRGGRSQTLMADQEVILSGGAINTPQLLQLSGIGDPHQLHAVGIQPVHELAGVGKNLQDHLALGLKQCSTQPISMLPLVQPARAAMSLAHYLVNGGGPAAYHGVQSLAFVKTRPDEIAPDLQYHFIMIMYDNHARNIVNQHGFMPYFNISRPKSRGEIRVKSADPKIHPLIQPNYFQDADDLRVMRDGIKISREIVRQKAFNPYRGEEYAPGKDCKSDAQIDEYVRTRVESIYHPVGTCKMGSDAMAVVDDRLRVHGIERLRVVDASIMPTLVSGNTNAPTIMIAEKASDFILSRAA